MGKISLFNITLNFSQFTAVSIGFGVGLVGRFLTSLPFLALREVKEFPLKPAQLFKYIFYSRKLIAISTTISFFIGFTLVLLGIMGYLP